MHNSLWLVEYVLEGKIKNELTARDIYEMVITIENFLL